MDTSRPTTPQRTPWLPLILVPMLCATPATRAGAAEIQRFEIDRQGDRHHLEAQVMIDAPLDDVLRILTDFERLHSVSPRIVESDLVAVSPDGIARVRTLNRLCFLFFCRDLRHVQLIRELAQGDFESNSVTEESDLSFGYARWRLFGEGDQTRLGIDFRFSMDSHSWLPSFVTRMVARSALRSDTLELVKGIEDAARTRPGGAHGG